MVDYYHTARHLLTHPYGLIMTTLHTYDKELHQCKAVTLMGF